MVNLFIRFTATTADGRTILYATDGKIKKVGSVQVNSLKIKGSGQNSNFFNSVPQSEENVNNHFSLSNEGKQPSTVGTPLRELALAHTQEDIAPIAENVTEKAPVAENATTTSEATWDYDAPVFEDISPMTEEEANTLQDEKSNADAKLEGEPKTCKQLHSVVERIYLPPVYMR